MAVGMESLNLGSYFVLASNWLMMLRTVSMSKLDPIIPKKLDAAAPRVVKTVANVWEFVTWSIKDSSCLLFRLSLCLHDIFVIQKFKSGNFQLCYFSKLLYIVTIMFWWIYVALTILHPHDIWTLTHSLSTYCAKLKVTILISSYGSWMLLVRTGMGRSVLI